MTTTEKIIVVSDMSGAGLEIGCKVNLPHGRHGIVKSIEGPAQPQVYVESLGTDAPYLPGELLRDFIDTELSRNRRMISLLEVFPLDRHITNWSEMVGPGLKRFILVQQSDVGILSAQLGDTFDEVVEYAGGEVLDGMMPEGVFDLDTGERVDLHVSSPIITRAEDQGIVVNALDPTDRDELVGRLGSEAAALDVLRNHRPIAEGFKRWTVTIGAFEREEEAHDIYVHNTHTADVFIERLLAIADNGPISVEAYGEALWTVPTISTRPDR